METLHTFTYGDIDAIPVAMQLSPPKYPMELNRTDLETVLFALHYTHENESHPFSDVAGDLLSSIMTTLGIEYI